ncbi:hypothetical protein THAOC_30644 [Thalassiosira oceanica]|uniref:Uncharacterized protein n=1 Tax=Thalassiosira oceanica TaxID=159749 RepID=K0RAY9_THAOC|nr:hypothetical protein THAOC_30644 [Thalassiosira oceanica]|eukprot:EJK50395.1 hypothetical protein THAOC_30644 [Thalassiosira oceanica]
MNQPTQRAEVEANARLSEIIKQIKLAESKLLELEERGKHQSRAWRMRGATLEAQKSRDDFTNEKLSEEDKMALFNVLNDQRLGMERLGDIVAKDSRDAAILHSELDRGQKGVNSRIGGYGLEIERDSQSYLRFNSPSSAPPVRLSGSRAEKMYFRRYSGGKSQWR